MRLIDADQLQKTIDKQDWDKRKTPAILAVDWIKMLIDEAPTIDAAPVVKNRDAILKKAIRTWGHRMQEDICIEEMSELTKALIKNRRLPSAENRQAIIEELADTLITTREMQLIFGETTKAEEAKLKRLAERLGRKEGEQSCG